jgi:CheY-like chemotaxis protein
MSLPPKTVMIIEDEPDIAELFAEMMRLNGYHVLKTYTSTPAMTLIAQEKPDVIILDIMMPDISGLEVLRYIRGEPTLAATPVIIVSAKSMPTDIEDGLEAGATVYLTKPVSYADLKDAVDNAVQDA